jgi:glutaminyl-peptide cyclotransferase
MWHGSVLRRHALEFLLVAVLLAAISYFAWVGAGLLHNERNQEPRVFSGDRSYSHASALMDFGPRPSGSEALRQSQQYIMATLAEQGWSVVTQTLDYAGVPVTNIIGRAGEGPIALVGAHYDTRREADADPDPLKRGEPVPGANDGASGAAVLLELAYALDLDALQHEVWLVFFDAEDNGRLDGWQWAVGSSYMAQEWAAGRPPGWEQLSPAGTTEPVAPLPDFLILVDMVGDANQQLYMEGNSSPGLTETLWSLAATRGYADVFIPETKWSLVDDHTAFLAEGVEAVDIIDFDYAHYHTTHDTLDKLSAESLERVGRVVEAHLEQQGE